MATACPSCGGSVNKKSDTAAQCSSCGKQFRIKPPTISSSVTYDVAKDDKACPYCGEAIKVVAVKCRHCGENLQREHSLNSVPSNRSDVGEKTLFEGSPSQWTNLTTFIFCGLMVLCGMWLMFTTRSIGFGIVIFASALIAVYRYIDVKYTQYLVTTERVEVEKGWISRQVDNLDLFRALRLTGIVNSRHLYDQLKHEALRADRRRGVVHVEA